MIESPFRYNLLCYCLFCGSYLATAQVPLESTLPILEISIPADKIPDERKVVGEMRLVDNGAGSTNIAGGSTREYTGQVAIERRGSTSQSFPKVGYAIELRERDGVTDRDASLLGMPEEEDWVLHNPYSDKTLLRNAFTYTLAGAMMPYAPRTRFVELILDGSYRGVYLLTERVKRDKHRVNIAKLDPGDTEGDELTGGYIIKLDKITGENFSYPSNWINERVDLDYAINQTGFLYEYPKPADLVAEQRGYIQAVTQEFESRLAGPDFQDSTLGYAPMIDLRSFIDFMLINEVTRNVDGYRLSTYLYKHRDSEGGRLHMGPVWDFNLALGNANYCQGAFTGGWAYDFNLVCPDDGFQVPFWWRRFMEDPNFKGALRARYSALRQNGPLSDEALTARVDSLQAELAGGPAKRNFEQWQIIGKLVWPNAYVERSYDDAVQFVRTWLPRRMAWLDGAIGLETSSTSSLAGPASDVTYLSPNPGGAEVRLEGLAASATRDITLLWFDASGAIVQRERLVGTSGTIRTPQQPGLYFWRASNSGEVVGRGKWVRQ